MVVKVWDTCFILAINYSDELLSNSYHTILLVYCPVFLVSDSPCSIEPILTSFPWFCRISLHVSSHPHSKIGFDFRQVALITTFGFCLATSEWSKIFLSHCIFDSYNVCPLIISLVNPIPLRLWYLSQVFLLLYWHPKWYLRICKFSVL